MSDTISVSGFECGSVAGSTALDRSYCLKKWRSSHPGFGTTMIYPPLYQVLSGILRPNEKQAISGQNLLRQGGVSFGGQICNIPVLPISGLMIPPSAVAGGQNLISARNHLGAYCMGMK